jgi:hypothetical protein
MKRKYHKELLATLVAESETVSDVMRKLNIRVSGGNHKHLSATIRKFGIDTSHFLGQASRKGKPNGLKKHWSEILVFREVSDRRQEGWKLRRALIESGREYICACCGREPIWNGKPLVLQVHHKDQNWLNDSPHNLDFVCPNCHSQE